MSGLSFRFSTVGSPNSTPRSGSADAAAYMPKLGLSALLHEKGCGGRMLSESPIMEADAKLFKKTWMQVSGEAEE